MITTIRPFGSVKKNEWNIYHNIGVQQDADRFSLIDPVLDGEYNNLKSVKAEGKALVKYGLWSRFGNWMKTKVSRGVYLSCLFCWFSLYCGVNAIAKLVSRI